MNNPFEKYSKFLFKLLAVAAILGAIYVTITYLIPFFAPFVLAMVIAMINQPIIRILQKRLKISRKLASLLSLLVTVSILGILITLGMIKIYNELMILKDNITAYTDNVPNQVTEYIDKILVFYYNLPEDITNTINENLRSLAPKVQGIVSSLITHLINTITSIPDLTVYAVVTVLSTYFITSDMEKIKTFVGKQVPERWSKNLSGIKTETFSALVGYIRAQFILIFITFVEVSIGLVIIGADYALVMGLLIGVSDLIPIVGSALIMIPWIGWNLITGNTSMALGLGIIYVIGVIVRQLLEPKLVGDQMGLHPLVTLIAMYVGFQVFGVLGMFIGPVTILILKNLNNSGALKLWND